MNLIQRVQPMLPNAIIESGLINAGFTLMSSIVKLRAGFNIEGFSYILNFNKQIFIKSDNLENKPTSIIVNHTDIAYRNYINDTVTCSHCKRGHISNQCVNLKKLRQPKRSLLNLKKIYMINCRIERNHYHCNI